MSAIFGLCHTDNKPVDYPELNSMLTALNHWGADDKNTWLEGNIGMGHLMLYNSPESLTEKLPYTDTLAQLTITADARIDNRNELCGLLSLTTPAERQMPDSQYILKTYQKYGEQCVNYLVGDFAFAIWDAREQKWFCARDQMGVRLFFYYYRDNVFTFASEKKGLLCLPEVDKKINKQYFYNQCFTQHVQAADTTLYQHIHRLKPAHTLSFYPGKNKITTQRYWTLDADTELRLARKEDYYDGLKQHFETAVSCRLRTNYDAGIELSGGIDSSSITGVVSHLMKDTGKRIYTFTMADTEESLPYTEKRGGSEVKYALEVTRYNGLEDPVWIRGEIYDDPQEVTELLEKITDGMERWNLSWELAIKKEAMDRNVRTMFSGFPGDELVTYRGQYGFLQYLYQKNYVAYIKADTKHNFNKLKPLMGPGMEYLMHKAGNLRKLNNHDVAAASILFPFPLKYRLRRGDESWQDESFRERYRSYRHFQKYRLLKPQISQRMETETQYATWFRMENCFPMADIRLAQFYLSMPDSMKHEGDMTRTAWRRSTGDYLPDVIRNRDSKSGVMFPYSKAPSAIETEMKSFAALINSYQGYNKEKKDSIISYFSNNGSITKSKIIFNWYRKNVGNF